MVEKCVVFECSNSRNKEKGISMHKIPSDSFSFGMVSFSYVTAKKSVKYWTLLIGLFLMSPRDKNLSSGAYSGQKFKNFSNF